MQGLATEMAPSPSVVIPHFVFAAVSFFILSFLLLFSGEAMTGYFLQPEILAPTHIAALGWGTMIIFGALYQLIPVVFEVSLYSESLAKTTFWTFGVGIVLMVYSFWTSSFGILLSISGSIVFVAIEMFTYNVIKSTQKSKKKNIQSLFVKTSTIWLGLTALLGLLLALNYKYAFLSPSHLLYLKMHAHMGLAGWFLMLIMGVGATLIPMFLVSHQVSDKNLKFAYYFTNIGLVILSIDWLLLHGSIFIPVWGIIITAGIIFFISFVAQSYKKRIRKILDIGMKHTMLSVFSLILPIILGLFASSEFIEFDIDFYYRIVLLYGFSLFFVFITSIILGQTYKTIPFIIWLVQYKALVGKTKTPLPKELYSEKLSEWQFYFYIASIISLITGILLANHYVIEIGAFLLMVTAILYNINVFKIVFHKTKPVGSKKA
jgi:hypothetical protein